VCLYNSRHTTTDRSDIYYVPLGPHEAPYTKGTQQWHFDSTYYGLACIFLLVARKRNLSVICDGRKYFIR